MAKIRRLLLALGVTLVLAGCGGSIVTPDFDTATASQDGENGRSTGHAGSGG